MPLMRMGMERLELSSLLPPYSAWEGVNEHAYISVAMRQA